MIETFDIAYNNIGALDMIILFYVHECVRSQRKCAADNSKNYSVMTKININNNNNFPNNWLTKCVKSFEKSTRYALGIPNIINPNNELEIL